MPTKLADEQHSSPRTLLVIPNNTGSVADELAVHDRAAGKVMERARPWADQLGVILLQPVFPRPKSDWRVYTHALDRDAMLTKKADLQRLDRQLLAMIEHTSERQKATGISVDRRVLLFGYSASGMFVNRFAFLHPERVKAAAIGSPGGWPLAPIARYKDKPLRYPIGVADFEVVAGMPFNREALARVPLFVFMGDRDTNDSVVFRDSYDEEDEKLMAEAFGVTPLARWPVAERLYRETLPRAHFKLYPGAEHKVTKEMNTDVLAFFVEQLK